MEEGNVCTFCKRSFLNKNLLDVHMTEHLGLHLGNQKHNNTEHDQLGVNRGNGVELDKKVIKKEIKLEVDGVKSCGPNENLKKTLAEVDKKVIKKEIKLEADEKVIKKEIKLEADEKVIKKEIKLEVNDNFGVKQEVMSDDLICKQCGEECDSLTGLFSHMRTHLRKRKRSNSDDEVKKGALSLLMISKDRKDLYFDEDKVVIPNVNVDGVKKEGNGPGQSSTGLVNSNLMPTYKCQTCFKEFSSRRSLGSHKKMHKNILRNNEDNP